VLAGQVEVQGRAPGSLARAGDLVAPDVALAVARGPTYVSRGGDKLAGALDALLPLDAGLDPTGRVCLDVGASTGGFTDVLLRRGAARVYALDVGRGQLAQGLRVDPRVVVLEGVNARYLSGFAQGFATGSATLPEPVSLAVIDVSFISLEKILAPVASVFDASTGGRIVALVKPQFEAGRSEARRGVVRDPLVRQRVVERIREYAEGIGLAVCGEVESSLAGPAGNREVFLDLEVPARPA
jgi:23S rRNA (cytidine1920-2'-O)/16S rRNA (cytidine1409-2'-O)-methyltransferase